MFSYRPPKGSCWGHVIRPKDPIKAKQKVNAFFEAYFERLEPQWDTTRQLTFNLNWKVSALPNIEWPEEFSKPENERWQRTLFMLTGNRVMFASGLLIPISPTQPDSYEFLRRFSVDAPFKMSPKHFQVGMVGKNGKLVWRKPDPDIAARLQDSIV